MRIMRPEPIKLLLGLTILWSLSGNLFSQDLKYAFIDMEHIFQNYYKTVKADETIKKQTDIFKEYAVNLEKERETIQEEFNSLRDISQNIALSEEVREEKRNEAQTKFMLLQEKDKEIQEYQKDKRLSLRKQYESQRNKLVKEIRDFIVVIAEKEEYDLVIDSSGNTLNGVPTFIYYRPEKEITDMILTMINKGHEDELNPVIEEEEEEEKEEEEE